MRHDFERFIGIDYSGAKSPDDPLSGLRVFSAQRAGIIEEVRPRNMRHWTRRYIYAWLREEIKENPATLIGIDHGFSFPKIYFLRHALKNWPDMLDDFIQHTPTHELSVETCRQQHRIRTESATSLRLCETWTSSAKSVFHFDVQGSVAKSTHAGLPWVQQLRREFPASLFCWPFDGWNPTVGCAVLCEVYPSIYSRRYSRAERGKDAHDAYAVVRWMQDMQQRQVLYEYFTPPLTQDEKNTAQLEGWILGVR